MSMMEMSKIEKSKTEKSGIGMSKMETSTLWRGQILSSGCESGNSSTLPCYFGPPA